MMLLIDSDTHSLAFRPVYRDKLRTLCWRKTLETEHNCPQRFCRSSSTVSWLAVIEAIRQGENGFYYQLPQLAQAIRSGDEG